MAANAEQPGVDIFQLAGEGLRIFTEARDFIVSAALAVLPAEVDDVEDLVDISAGEVGEDWGRVQMGSSFLRVDDKREFTASMGDRVFRVKVKRLS